MPITLTEQIDQAFQKGGLSFMEAQAICELHKERKELDEFMFLKGGKDPDKEGSKKLEKLTNSIIAILEKIELTASERLQLTEQKMKRFKIHDQLNGTIFESITTQEIFDHAMENKLDYLSFSVYCGVDEIEVEGVDFMQSFHENECPGDLQFF